MTYDISLEKAKKEKLFYFVATGIIYNSELKKCLILQRSKKETTHPGLWGVVGGKLEWNDIKNNSHTKVNFDVLNWDGLVEKLLQREAMEEAGIEIGDLRYLENVVYIRPDKVPAVCLKFAVLYKSGDVKISSDFDNYAWVDKNEVKQYETIEGIDNEISKTIDLFIN